VRVIKPGGALIVECPCIDKIIKLWEVPGVPPWLTYWGLYGDPRLGDPLMMHHWCYSVKQLMGLMMEAGLVDVRNDRPQFHQEVRDMRIVGWKPKEEPKIVVANEV
jgi:hypothetical protein